MSRHELIAAPLTVWLAPVGTSFPDIGVEPPAAWNKLGKMGDENYTEDGVTVQLPQTLEGFTPAGATMPAKMWRTESGVIVGVTVADVRAEVMKYALNGNEVTEATGTFSLPLLRDVDVTEYALLARGQSPYDNGEEGQFQVPRVVVDGEPEIVFTKGGDPAAIEFEFTALDPADAADDFKVIFEDAV